MPNNPSVLARTPEKDSIIGHVDRFQVRQQICRGAYSSIHLGFDIGGEKVAVKVMDLRKHHNEFTSEVNILSKLEQYDGIVNIITHETLRSTGFIYLDYIPHPTLYTFVKRSTNLDERCSLNVFWNILMCMEIIHGEGIAHRDVKPENLMINPETHKITILDFGLSLILQDGQMIENFCGSPMYMAPEVLTRQKHDPKVADIWSLGVLLYFMLVGNSPWSAVESLDELLDIVIFEPVVELPSFLSKDVCRLLDGILKADPKVRLPLCNIQEQVQSIVS